MLTITRIFTVALIFTLTACGSGDTDPDAQYLFHENENMNESEHDFSEPVIEARSLFGAGLVRPDFDPQTASRLQADLRNAIENHNNEPERPESILWVARNTAALWRYHDAILVLSNGLESYPDDPRYYRFRGHYMITIREFEVGKNDLRKAVSLLQSYPDQPEPDEIDGSVIEPSTTLHYNVWYHLGLAHYLTGEYVEAFDAFEKARNLARNADSRIAASDWQILAAVAQNNRSLVQSTLQSVQTDINIAESDAFLKRVQFYKGDLTAEDALQSAGNPFEEVTVMYGVARWLLWQGNQERAQNMFADILDTNLWAATSYITAEAILYKLREAST